MTFEQFKYHLDVYGASFDRWPAELRREAEAFAASSPAAAAAQAEVLRLDRLLDHFAPAQDGAAEARMVGRVTALVASTPPRARGLDALFDLGWLWPQALWPQALWPRAAALALVALLGIMIGVVQVEQAPAEMASADFTLVASSDSSLGVAGL
jgi:hypothetical protein